MNNFTEPEFFDFLQRLREDNEVNNLATANPIFLVQELVLISGMDREYTDLSGWYDTDTDRLLSDEDMLAMGVDADVLDEEEIEYDGNFYEKVFYKEQWQYVSAHITRKSASDFINRKQQDYEKLRVFVDSQHYCTEYIKVINYLLSQAESSS